MMNENLKNNSGMTDDAINTLLLNGFDHAIETMMNDSTKETALTLTRAYFGEDATEDGVGFKLTLGYLLGVNEGMRIMAAINGDAEYLAACDQDED